MGEIHIYRFKKPVLYPLCSGEYRKSQLLFLLDGVFINASVILTTGMFLSGYLVWIDASDLLAGIVNNSATWGSVIAVSSFLIYERLERRKALLIALNFSSRLLVCSIVFLPLVTGNKTVILGAASVMVILGNILWNYYATGLNVWVTNIVAPDKRNEFIFVRTLWLRVSFTVVTVVMGFVLDWFHKSYTGFLVVFSTGLLFAVLDICILIRIKEPPNTVHRDQSFNVAAFLEPVRSGSYRNFLGFVFFFYLGQTISTSFTPIYLIRYLKLDYSFISGVNVVMYAFMIASTRFWRHVEAKKGLEFVLKVSILFVIGEVLLYSFLTSRTQALLFVAPVIAGIGYGGFNIAIFNYRYEIMPEENKTLYEGWFGAVFGVSVLISPMIGGFLMGRLPAVQNSVYQYGGFQLLYLLSFVIDLLVVYLMFYRTGGRLLGANGRAAHTAGR